MHTRNFAPRRKGLPGRSLLLVRRWLFDVPVSASSRATEVIGARLRRRQDFSPQTRWVGERKWRRLLKLVGFWVAMVMLVAIAVLAVGSFVTGKQWTEVIRWISSHKKRSGFGGDVASTIVFAVAPILVGLAVFLTRPYQRVKRRYVRQAIESPIELVPTAGSIVGEVVGRDDLCNALQSELRTRATRRPHVLVGGLGVGKTAVLVQLTRLLARRGAVPVPVRLRDVGDEMDFLELARQRFLYSIRLWLRTSSEGDKIWRRLVYEDRVVVLADGLEEAFADDEKLGQARNHRVRVAMKRAAAQRYALIVASRPHDALRALDAAITHLEPLSEDDALDYVRGAEKNLEDALADPLIDVAQITDVPLYLRIAHDLNREDLLKDCVNAACRDRIALRCSLLNGWLDALVTRKLHETEDVALTEADRRSTLAHLAALAYVGLRHDTQQVTLEMWDRVGEASSETDEQRNAEDQIDVKREFKRRIQTQITKIHEQYDHGNAANNNRPIFEMQAAMSKGFRLDLVEPIKNGVRFPHSLMQACLGAHVMGVAIEHDSENLRRALERPGRELLIALAMFSRRPYAFASQEHASPQVEVARVMLLEAINKLNCDAKWLDIVSAAIEIDASLGRSRHDLHRRHLAFATRDIEIDVDFRFAQQRRGTAMLVAPPDVGSRDVLGAARARPWTEIGAQDDATLDAKRNLIARVAEAARTPSASDGGSDRDGDRYRYLYDICLAESDYGVRLAAAQEIGSAGDAAWNSLESQLLDQEFYGAWTDWNGRMHACRQQQKTLDSRIEADPERWPEFVREAHLQRIHVLHAWLLPMLLSSVRKPKHRERLDEHLGAWIKCVGAEADGSMPLSIEAALAQGFKYAANRRPHHSHEHAESRQLLQKHARAMIYSAGFWYSRLSLLHALCLWELARAVYAGHAGHEAAGRLQDPYALVSGWLRRQGPAGVIEEPHPFVLEAADLARRALETRQPERFIWIDESGVVTKVGAKSHGREHRLGSRLWITPSAGWMTLDRRAQQLVADVLIVLNLAERDQHAEERERGLRKANIAELPRCISGDRCKPLQPAQTAGTADVPNPGQTCRAKCKVGLCPYPPRGLQPYRDELSQAFCRRQEIASQRWIRDRPGRWQHAPRSDLRTFWKEMETRARR